MAQYSQTSKRTAYEHFQIVLNLITALSREIDMDLVDVMHTRYGTGSYWPLSSFRGPFQVFKISEDSSDSIQKYKKSLVLIDKIWTIICGHPPIFCK